MLAKQVGGGPIPERAFTALKNHLNQAENSLSGNLFVVRL